MTTDDLAGLLEACALGFPDAKRIPSGATGICGGCGRPVTEPTLAAHQAAVITAAGWVKGRDDLEPVRTYYRSLTPDGKLWCESRNPEEVRARSEGKGCTFERYDIYEVTEGWQPWAEGA